MNEGLEWLIGKTITGTQIVRAPMNLELHLSLLDVPELFAFELRLPDTLDWFETHYMAVEGMVGRTVFTVEDIEHSDDQQTHHEYRLTFIDGTYIDIFADVLLYGGNYRHHEELFFRVFDPDEESEDTPSIADEIEADIHSDDIRRQDEEEGQLYPEHAARYLKRF
jgi:hypothetical protein